MTELIFPVAAPAKTVFHYLSHHERFVEVHPLIHRMDKLADGRYKVFERVKFGPLKLPFSYIADIHADAENLTVDIRTTVHKLVHLHLHFTVEPKEEQCIVREIIQINSLLPVYTFMKSLIHREHERMFNAIAAL